MLTFEKVMEVFKDYLAEDTRYEIVMTSRGYTVLEWDSCYRGWESAIYCATPDKMAEILLDDLAGYLEYKATLGRRDPTDEDMAQINAQRQEYAARLH